MPTTTSLQAIPVPVATDAPDGPTQMTNLAKALEQKSVMVFASAAARTSAFTAAAVSPAAGMLCYRSDAPGQNRHEYYNATSGSWRVFGPYRDFVTLASSAASASFTSIPTYLRVLRVHVRARATNAALFSGINVTIGGDSTAAYSSTKNYQQNATNNVVVSATAQTSSDCGYCPGASASAGRFGDVSIEIAGWDNPTASSLTIIHQGGYMDNGSNFLSSRGVSVYSGSAAYTSLTIAPGAGSFLAGSQFTLTGWE